MSILTTCDCGCGCRAVRRMWVGTDLGDGHCCCEMYADYAREVAAELNMSYRREPIVEGEKQPMCQKTTESEKNNPLDHSDHGRGTHDGDWIVPDDSDCPCRATVEQVKCAAAGCGFCAASEQAELKQAGRKIGGV